MMYTKLHDLIIVKCNMYIKLPYMIYNKSSIHLFIYSFIRKDSFCSFFLIMNYLPVINYLSNNELTYNNELSKK